MSKSQRTKGLAFEQECVREFNEFGLCAERNLSQSRDGGYDIDSLAGAFECKRRAHMAAFLKPSEGVRGVVSKCDRGPTLVILRLPDFLALAKLEIEERNKQMRDARIPETLQPEREYPPDLPR